MLGGIASGRVGIGNATGDAIDSWLNPTSALIGVIAVLTGAPAAVFLAGDSVRAEQPDLARAVRRGGRAGAERRGRARRLARAALGRPLSVRRADLRLRAGLVSSPRWRRRDAGAGLERAYGLARATSTLAVVAIVVGWALAQNPYLLPPTGR